MKLEKVEPLCPLTVLSVITLLDITFSGDRSQYRDEVHRILNEPEIYGDLYALWDDGFLVGTVSYGPCFIPEWNGEGNISHLAIHPKRRREGHGKRIVDHAIADMKAQGLPCVCITIAQDNEVAKKFWANYDFEIYYIGHKSIYGVHDCYVMWFKEGDND